MPKRTLSQQIGRAFNALGLFLLIAFFFIAMFGIGFALQASGWGWVAVVAVFAIIGLALYRILK